MDSNPMADRAASSMSSEKSATLVCAQCGRPMQAGSPHIHAAKPDPETSGAATGTPHPSDCPFTTRG